jgi:protein MpaA
MINILHGLSREHLVNVGNKNSIHRMAFYSWKKLQKSAALEGIDLQVLSGFRSFEDQLKIWNNKAKGKRPVLSIDSLALDVSSMPAEELMWNILNWSALPGLSRHHWGTDLDVYDANAGVKPKDIQLVPAEYAPGGPFARLGKWLQQNLNTSRGEGFFRPYDKYLGGVQVEPWHISWGPLSEMYQQEINKEAYLEILANSKIELYSAIWTNVHSIIERYTKDVCFWKKTGPFLLEQNSNGWGSKTYGRSVNNIPLEVYEPEDKIKLLVMACIHGNESETTFVLSKAIRSMQAQGQSLKNTAVILCANPDGMMQSTRANAAGVDLNRNFPCENWTSEAVYSRPSLDEVRSLSHSTGFRPQSEPEVDALIQWIQTKQPTSILTLHGPLACVDDPETTLLARTISSYTDLPLVDGVGYETPGSMGTWCKENNIPIVTWEFPRESGEELAQRYTLLLQDILTGQLPKI